jgi:hypothetical protein
MQPTSDFQLAANNKPIQTKIFHHDQRDGQLLLAFDSGMLVKARIYQQSAPKAPTALYNPTDGME